MTLIKLLLNLKRRKRKKREENINIIIIIIVVVASRDHLQSQEMVAEMVYYFLLPEVEKETIREKGTCTCI